MKHIKLLKTKKGRDETGLFIVEGLKFVDEIPHTWHIEQYIFAKHFADNQDISKYQSRAPYSIVKDSIFDSLASTVSPQGIIAICKKQELSLINLQENATCTNPLYLICENLNDPGNIGALIRTAAAAGAAGIILTHGSGDVYNPKVLRAAAGAVLRTPIIENVTLLSVVSYMQERNIPIYAAHPRGTALPYDVDMKQAFCLLVGNESHGISQTAADMASSLISLPMVNTTESLNASVAGSVLLYEAVRQRI